MYIDINLYKKIAFVAGMPSIVVDLMMYLSGGINPKQPYQTTETGEKVKKTIKLLEDRVKATSRRDSIKQNVKRGTLKPFEEEKVIMKDLEEGLLPYLSQKLMKLINRKVNKMIPPFKDMPDAVDSEYSYDSDDPV